jgi:regulator of replication initiation timing
MTQLAWVSFHLAIAICKSIEAHAATTQCIQAHTAMAQCIQAHTAMAQRVLHTVLAFHLSIAIYHDTVFKQVQPCHSIKTRSHVTAFDHTVPIHLRKRRVFAKVRDLQRELEVVKRERKKLTLDNQHLQSRLNQSRLLQRTYVDEEHLEAISRERKGRDQLLNGSSSATCSSSALSSMACLSV